MDINEMVVGKRERERESKSVSPLTRKVIYVYKHLDVKSHEGWLKVGETLAKNITDEGNNRRIADQNSAANIAYEVLYETDAVTNGGQVFSDHDIHAVLEAMDIEREETFNPETKRQSEWFRTSLETVIEVIEDYKKEADKPGAEILTNFTLREEQNEAVARTREYYEAVLNGKTMDATDEATADTTKTSVPTTKNLEPAFLWNAKPRFGKTLTAYSFAAEIRAQNVLIVTNRPAIADSWWSDFYKFGFSENGQNDGRHRWVFTCSEAVKKRLTDSAKSKGKDLNGVYTRAEQLWLLSKVAPTNNNHKTIDNSDNNIIINNNGRSLSASYRNLVHFISLQDIKGYKSDEGMEGFKKQNQWIFDLHWDLLIIDESHEGADTRKALRVFDAVNHDFTLHLSGTPFKALASRRFEARQIYNWSYSDEQKAKRDWAIADGNNPYANLPQMNIYTYQLSRALQISADQAKDEDAEYAFDLGEFLKVGKVEGEVKFVYEDEVRKFIKNLSDPTFEYPFSKEEGRENLRHTFWLLPGVAACNLMKKLLLEDAYFGSQYKSEDIIVAAGDGDEDKITKTALGEVRKRIGRAGGAKHPLETRTITLSCGQLTTGVTVPEWSAVLMLNNCKSPALYMQAAFRAQNPYSVATSGGECFIKKSCYVFDFAPDRVLQTLAEMAESTTHGSKSSTREEAVRKLINFLPVLGEDNEGRMKYLDANEVLTIPLKLITEEVVSRGFMSNRLFENISNIFGCPKEIADIINKMDEAKTGREVERNKKSKVSNTPRVWVDGEKKIHINEDIVINTTNGLLGDKKYVEIGSDEGCEVEEILKETKAQTLEAGHDTATVNAELRAVEKRLPKLVATLPEPEPQPGEAGYFEKEEPDEKPTRSEPSDEQKVRDRLRGFARTIPSFLMAYGSSATKLENFGDNIPEEVFQELTNISKDEFRQIRDGFEAPKLDEDGNEVLDANGQPVMEHHKGFINESVFNSSVAEFVARRKALACYWTSDTTEDIFEYILPQQNNQIFTPRKVVREMVDLLEKESPGIFASTTNTFIDLYMKSGMYITEIVRRIFAATRERYGSDTECIRHILENQVYGFAPTPILKAITDNYIFGFDEGQTISRAHFIKLDTALLARDGSLPAEIFKLFNGGNEMKFSAVVGNPPYQINDEINNEREDGSVNASASPIYDKFVLETKCLQPENFTLIMPARWLSGAGKGLNSFSKEMLQDEQISNLTLFPNSKDVFPNVDIKGGVCYFLWQKGHSGPAKVNICSGEKVESSERFLDSTGSGVFAQFAELGSILSKVQQKHPDLKKNNIQGEMSVLKPYGLRTDIFKNQEKYGLPPIYDTKQNEDDLEILGLDSAKRTIKYVPKDYPFPTGKDTVGNWKTGKWKVFIPYAYGCGAIGEVIPTPVLGTPVLACTETFMRFGSWDTKNEAEHAMKYLKTKFFRALVGILKTTQHATTCYKFVPVQDFTDKSDIDWTKSIPEIDQRLYQKYGLSENEIEFIEQHIKEMG